MEGDKFWKGRLDDDGLLLDIYPYLWSVQDHLEGLSIPDTVLFEQGYPKVYFSWEGYHSGVTPYGRELRKYLGSDIREDQIIRKFGAMATADLVAEYSTYGFDNSGMKYLVKVDYLDLPGLKQLLSRRAPGGTGILQRFLQPKTSHNSVFQAVWCASATFVSNRKNRNALNTSVPVAEKGVTFDGPQRFSTWGVVTPYTQKRIEKAANDLVLMLNLTESTTVTGLVCLMKIDCRGNLFLVNCTSIRTSQANIESNVTGARNPISMGIDYSTAQRLGEQLFAVRVPQPRHGVPSTMRGFTTEPNKIQAAQTLRSPSPPSPQVQHQTTITGGESPATTRAPAPPASTKPGGGRKQSIVTLMTTENSPITNTVVPAPDMTMTLGSRFVREQTEEERRDERIHKAVGGGVLTIDLNNVTARELDYMEYVVTHTDAKDELKMMRDSRVKFNILVDPTPNSAIVIGNRVPKKPRKKSKVQEGISIEMAMAMNRMMERRHSRMATGMSDGSPTSGGDDEGVQSGDGEDGGEDNVHLTAMHRVSSAGSQRGRRRSSAHQVVDPLMWTSDKSGISPPLVLSDAATSPAAVDLMPIGDASTVERRALFEFLREQVYHSLDFRDAKGTLGRGGPKVQHAVSGLRDPVTSSVAGSRLRRYKFMLPVHLREKIPFDRVDELVKALDLGREYNFDEDSGQRVDILYLKRPQPYTDEELAKAATTVFPPLRLGSIRSQNSGSSRRGSSAQSQETSARSSRASSINDPFVEGLPTVTSEAFPVATGGGTGPSPLAPALLQEEEEEDDATDIDEDPGDPDDLLSLLPSHLKGRVALPTATPPGQERALTVHHGSKSARVARKQMHEYETDWRIGSGFPKLKPPPRSRHQAKSWREREESCQLTAMRRLLVQGERSYSARTRHEHGGWHEAEWEQEAEERQRRHGRGQVRDEAVSKMLKEMPSSLQYWLQ